VKKDERFGAIVGMSAATRATLPSNGKKRKKGKKRIDQEKGRTVQKNLLQTREIRSGGRQKYLLKYFLSKKIPVKKERGGDIGKS